MRRLDVLVVGSGPGPEVSSTAAERGLELAVVEEGPFGGTCLNRGCIPSKMLIHSADVMETIRRAELLGIKARMERIDWSAIIRRVAEEIDGEAGAVEQGNRQAPNIAVCKGRGRFVGVQTLEVNGERITPSKWSSPPGTRPSIPPIPGLEDALHVIPDEARRLPEQPRRLLIIGSGSIAAELAHFFGAVGTAVAIVHRRPTLLGEEDISVARRLTEVYGVSSSWSWTRGWRVPPATRAAWPWRSTPTARRESWWATWCCWPPGRVPNTDRLDVAPSGVAVDEHGFVRADSFLETNELGTWALGNIVGKYLLKHSANLEAAAAAYNRFHPDQAVAVDYTAMPHAIFASPQVAGVGLTEQEMVGKVTKRREPSLPDGAPKAKPSWNWQRQMVLHILLSMVYGVLFAAIVAAWRGLRTGAILLLGVLFGRPIWVVNFYVIAPIAGWTWFPRQADPVQRFVAHAIAFGGVLGWLHGRAGRAGAGGRVARKRGTTAQALVSRGAATRSCHASRYATHQSKVRDAV